MLAYQHLRSRIYSTLPFMTICCIYQGFSIARTEGMCSLGQSCISEWSRLHALIEIPGKYAFAYGFRICKYIWLTPTFNLMSESGKVNIVLPSSGYSLSIKSVEIIFRPYYFVKLFGSINSRKSILKNHIFFFFFFFCNRGKFALLH